MRRPLVLFACVLACSTDSFGTDSGAVDATPDGIPGTDASPVDAPTVEASPPPADASDGMAIAPFACTSPPTGTLLCDDFEGAPTLTGTQWISLFALGGGTGALDTTYSVSPTHSALFTVPAFSTGVGWADLYYQAVSVTAARLELRADVRVHQLDMSQSISLLRIWYPPPSGTGGEVDYDVVASGSQLSLVATSPAPDGGVSLDTQSLQAYALDAWFDVRYEVDTSGMAPVVTVWLANSQVASRSFASPLPSSLDGTRNINLGVAYEASTTVAADVNYDNVNFRAY